MSAERSGQSTSTPYRGHAHFWERALARRTVIRAAAGATGAAFSAGLWLPEVAQATVSGPTAPNPIPGGVTLPTALGLQLFHFYFPNSTDDPSSITDFNGFIAQANIDGGGRGNDGVRYTFDNDVRFMQGLYIGKDGRRHQGTFGFF